MRINVFKLIVALVVGALIFYGFYTLETKLLLSILGTVICTLLLIASISIQLPENPRSSLMFKTLAGVLFVLLLPANFIFIVTDISETIFIITNGVITAIGAIGLHFIYKSEQ